MPLKPNSREWLEALAKQDPDQATITAAMVEAAGKEDVCSVCGDEPSLVYRKRGSVLDVDALRLCTDCLGIRRNKGEQFDTLS